MNLAFIYFCFVIQYDNRAGRCAAAQGRAVLGSFSWLREFPDIKFVDSCLM
jgi:hypothetical protein